MANELPQQAKAETAPAPAGARAPKAPRGTLLAKLHRFSSASALAQERLIALTTAGTLAFLLLATYWLGAARLVNAGTLPFLYLAAWGTALSAGVLWHFKAYRGDFTCMTGMMIGMTLGMVPGFLAGTLIGALNGLFPGTVLGMLIGMAVGSWAGKCCGVMGVMEAMMAGLMAGTMGAMMALMLLNQYYLPFLVILNASTTLMLLGLSYAMYRESGPTPARQLHPARFGLVTIIAFFALSAFLTWGPRVGLVWIL